MIINMLIVLFKYLNIKSILDKAYEELNIPDILSRVFEVPIRVDNMSRIYGVLHPLSQHIGEQSQVAYELTMDGVYSTETYVKQWFYDRLSKLSRIIESSAIMDLLSPLDLTKIDDDNYLMILKPVGYDKLMTSIKYAITEIVTLVLMLITYLIFF